MSLDSKARLTYTELLSGDSMMLELDAEDWDIYYAYPWCWTGRYYIYNDGVITRSLHREIMNAPPDKVVDHINGNTLDNRKINLRLCTQSENRANAKKQSGKLTSKYKGVSYDSKRKHYKVYVSKNRSREYIGSFKDEDAAGLAYNKAALRIFGEFALLNIIEEKV